MHLTILVFLALAVAVPTLAHNENTYKNGYYQGRSADIIIDDADVRPVEVQLEWQLMKKQSHGSRANVTHVQDVHVYNLISRALGLPQIKLPKSYSMESQMDDSVPFNPFLPLHGNVFFSIEGLSSESVPSSTRALAVSPVYVLTQTARPYNPLSVLATVVTGTQPRRHGIVNDRDLTSMATNLFDVAQALYLETTVVSGSTTECFATALSAHKNADSYKWDSETGAFVPLNKETATVVVSKDNLITHLAALGFSSKIVFQPEVEAKVGSVNFDVKDEVDVALFAEVAFVYAWSTHLQQTSSQKFLNYHFRSLPQIAEKYGHNSPQWTTAVELIDATIAYSIATLKDCAFEVVYLPTHHNERIKAIKSLVTPITARHTNEERFPQIYLTEAGQEKQEELCREIRRTISDKYPDTTVFCPLHSEERKRMTLESQLDPVIPLVPLVATDIEVLRFHYVFWTLMVLLVALIWATCALAYIPPDESLYTASTFYKKGGKL